MILVLVLGALLLVSVSKGADVVDYLDEKTDAWTRFDFLFKKYGSQYNIPWQWLKAFCLVESDLGRAKSVALGMREPSNIEGSKSSDGKSWGIMQVTLRTGSDFDKSITVEKLNDPVYSVEIACKYISWTINFLNKSSISQSNPRWIEAVVKSYNQGVGNTVNEFSGKKGYANEYWLKWQKQLKRVIEG